MPTDNMKAIALGVNVDHVATVRNARGTPYPDPVHAALLAEQAGADSITMHLREDRRHIRDRDLELMCEMTKTRVNMEMACTEEMLSIAERLRPADCCLVPERREELTTEGGLDVAGQKPAIAQACERLSGLGIRVSLFIDADQAQLEAAREVGAAAIELHTGRYADLRGAEQAAELDRLTRSAHFGDSIGLTVHAGHGLTYHNVGAIAAIEPVVELNIGHGLVSSALFEGLGSAVSRMRSLMQEARH